MVISMVISFYFKMKTVMKIVILLVISWVFVVNTTKYKKAKKMQTKIKAI